MKKVILVSLLVFGYITQGYSQESKIDQDKQAIKDMCGCFKVQFRYTETFAPELDYEKHLDYTSGALEWAELIEDANNNLSIQHLLVINDTMIIKHWRQDWLYENQQVFHYDKGNTWNFKTLPKEEVKGQWTQKVYQIDDSPRYSGSATWIHADGKHYWENRSDTPLPRREYSKRKDYNVMSRGNRQEITSTGWVHEQDNDKIIRKTGEVDVLLVHEKGYNTYVKVPDEACLEGKIWWQNNAKFWSKARKSWRTIYERETPLTLRKSVNKQPLFMHMYPLEKENKGRKAIDTVLDQFVVKTKEDEKGK